MREKLKRIFVIVGLALTIILRPTIALAETIEQDDLKVRFELEEVQGSEYEVNGKIIITNIGIRPIEDIKLNSIIPEGLKIKDGDELSKDIGVLAGGESSTHEFSGVLDKPLSGGDINTDNPTNDESTQTTTKPSDVNTGDNSNIFMLIVVIAVCAGLMILLSKKKNKSAKEIISLFLALTIFVTIIQNPILVKANENQKKEVSIDSSIEVNGKKYDFKTLVSYTVSNNNLKPSGKVINRGEWISELVNASGLKNEQEIDTDTMEHGFNDIEDNEFKEDIIYAKAYSLLNNEGESFKPDEPATREFAAVTAVKVLGFEPIQDIICDDSSEITYLKEVEIAVGMGIINLQQNKFYPLRSLTQAECDYIIEAVKAILKSTEVNEDYDSVIEYKDGVIKFEESDILEINDSIIKFKVNNKTKNLKAGNVFVLPGEKPYKVVESTNEDNTVIVSTEEPKMEEVLSYLDVQDAASVDMSKFIPAEGVEINIDDTPQARIDIDQEGSISGPGAINLSFDKKISDTFKLAGSVDFSLPKISYKADVNVGLFDIDINNVFLKFQTKTKAIGKLSANVGSGNIGNKKDGLIELGKVPIVGIPGVAIYAQIGLEYSVEGKISVVFTVDGDVGVQVLNNRLRPIRSLKSKLDLPEADVTGKIGPKLSGLLEICGLWDLIDFSANTGIGASITSVPNNNNLKCADANVYWYLDLSALDLSIIGDWLNLKYNWIIFNKSNSPLKVKFHLENLNKVPTCTYGTSIIKGTVAEAGNRNKFIQGVNIKVYNSTTNKLEGETQSDANGKYSLNVKPGSYNIKISKDGYVAFDSKETIVANEEKFIETYLMVGSGTSGEQGIAGGKITNALTGDSVPGAVITVRKGWNNAEGNGEITTFTDKNGKYEVELPIGNYTVEISKEGYITNYYNIYVMSGSTLNQNNTIIPDSSELPTGELRIVLTWGDRPTDLDSHLVGPTADGKSNFHIYYRNKSYHENGIEFADLDLDDVTSYGPETTTVYNMNSTGKYSFYVHDYSNKYDPSSTSMSNSGAMVKVYKGDILCASYPIPTNNAGVYWKIFDFDAETNTIIPVNQFVDSITYQSANPFRFNQDIWNIEEKIAN